MWQVSVLQSGTHCKCSSLYAWCILLCDNITEDSHVSSFLCLQLLVLVGGEVKRAQIYFLCGLEVKLVLKCFASINNCVQVNQNLQILLYK